MLVPVVQVRVVRMIVRQRPMPVPMIVRFTRRIVRTVCVLVMRVVVMKMLVLHRIVGVQVLMPLCEMKPHARSHQ